MKSKPFDYTQQWMLELLERRIGVYLRDVADIQAKYNIFGFGIEIWADPRIAVSNHPGLSGRRMLYVEFCWQYEENGEVLRSQTTCLMPSGMTLWEFLNGKELDPVIPFWGPEKFAEGIVDRLKMEAVAPMIYDKDGESRLM